MDNSIHLVATIPRARADAESTGVGLRLRVILNDLRSIRNYKRSKVRLGRTERILRERDALRAAHAVLSR